MIEMPRMVNLYMILKHGNFLRCVFRCAHEANTGIPHFHGIEKIEVKYRCIVLLEGKVK